jgi:hypothetical protein
MHIVELISTGDGQIIEKLDKIGIKLFMLGCTERKLLVSFVILFVLRSVSVNALQIVLSNSLYESTAKWETCQIFKYDRLLAHI